MAKTAMVPAAQPSLFPGGTTSRTLRETRERGVHGKPRASRSRVSGLLVFVVDNVDRRFLRGGPAAIDTRVAGDLVFLKVDERVGNVIPVFVR